MSAAKKKSDRVVVASNRKARQYYKILDNYEAGLSLKGAEVKALRQGRASLDGCFGRPEGDELFLYNFYIPPYSHASVEPPDPRRIRKLLLHKREVAKIIRKLSTKGLTLIPLEIYFRRGWAKVDLGLAQGKAGPDKREDLKKRAVQRDSERIFRGR